MGVCVRMCLCALMYVREEISCGMSLEMEKVCFLFAETTTTISSRLMHLWLYVCAGVGGGVCSCVVAFAHNGMKLKTVCKRLKDEMPSSVLVQNWIELRNSSAMSVNRWAIEIVLRILFKLNTSSFNTF